LLILDGGDGAPQNSWSCDAPNRGGQGLCLRNRADDGELLEKLDIRDGRRDRCVRQLHVPYA
jgi:hypothetical protein